jgi:hypothetical protein
VEELELDDELLGELEPGLLKPLKLDPSGGN